VTKKKKMRGGGGQGHGGSESFNGGKEGGRTGEKRVLESVTCPQEKDVA